MNLLRDCACLSSACLGGPSPEENRTLSHFVEIMNWVAWSSGIQKDSWANKKRTKMGSGQAVGLPEITPIKMKK